VAPRLIVTVFLIALEGLLSRERFGALLMVLIMSMALMMALIVPIALGNVVFACCHLLQLRLAPTLTLHSRLSFFS
jgi:hypothetical protein